MKHGFTFIELVVVMGILTTLMGLASINLLQARATTTTSATLTTFIADLRNQQQKAMSGDTETRGVTSRYGVYLDTTSYVLFHGDSYAPNDPANFRITLDDSLTLSSTIPASTLLFEKGSGEVVSYANGQDTVTFLNIHDTTTTTVTVNQLGVISSVN